MTLIVSLRIPDGIVIAGDSLASMMSSLELQGDMQITCPQCGHQHKQQTKIGGIQLPATTLSFAQKVFPFLGDYGIGTFGMGQVMGKTPYFATRQLEKQLEKQPIASRPSNVTEAAEQLGKHMHNLLKQQVKKDAKDINSFPDNWKPIGFQVVGYNGEQPTSLALRIGKQVTTEVKTDLGITATGETSVLQALGSIFTTNPQARPVYSLFSLQDAIAYSEFVISTTASFQQFSRTVPNVGGEIDVALVTPFDHFKWIRQKSLQSKLERKPSS